MAEVQARVHAPGPSPRRTSRTGQILLVVVLSIYALIVLFPLLIVLVPTFQTVQESSQGILTPPSQLNFQNYARAWERSNFPRALGNSVLITGGTLIISIAFGGLAAFPMGIRGNRRVYRIGFFFFLVGLMLPFQSVMIPLYVMMTTQLRLTNTYIGVILVYAAMTLPLTIFFYSQFIKTIPRELEEASLMDGCGYFRMYWQVFFPLLRPITAAIVIQNLIFLWNDLLVPLILISDDALKPIMPSVYVFFGTYYNRWNEAFSVLVLAAIPFIVLFLLLQKQFIRGLSQGAVKG